MNRRLGAVSHNRLRLDDVRRCDDQVRAEAFLSERAQSDGQAMEVAQYIHAVRLEALLCRVKTDGGDGIHDRVSRVGRSRRGVLQAMWHRARGPFHQFSTLIDLLQWNMLYICCLRA